MIKLKRFRVLKQNQTFSLGCLLAVLLAFVALLYLYIDSEKEINLAYERQNEAYRLVNELRQSSDDLSRMVRAYVATSDSRYQRHFQEIVGIRDGTLPRPLRYDNIYWDLVLSDEKRPREFGPAQSLLSLIQEAGFTPAEFSKLKEAKTTSDALTLTEYEAMDLIESFAPNIESNRLKATAMLTGAAYMANKAEIMRPISEFRDMIDARTTNRIQEVQVRQIDLIKGLIGLGCVIFLLLSRQVVSLWRDNRNRQKSEAAYVSNLEQQVTDRSNSLRMTEELLRLFIQHSPVALAMLNTDMRYLMTSERWLSDYGLLGRTLDGLSHFEVFPDLTEGWKAVYQRALSGETIKAAEDAFVRLDGSSQWLRWEVLPWYKSEHEVGGLIIFSEDITEQKHTAQALDRVQLLMQNGERIAQIGSWEYLVDSQQTLWSKGERDIYGIDSNSPSPNYQTMLQVFIHPYDVARLDQTFRNALTQRIAFQIEHKIVRPNGEVRQVRELAYPDFDDCGNLVKYFGTTLDITESSRMERREHGRAEILEAIVTGTPLPEVLDLLVRHIEQESEGALCSILLLDDTRTHLRTGAAPSLSEAYNRAIDGMTIGHGQGSCGTAAFDNCRVVVDDIQTHPYWMDFKELAKQAGLASCWSEPIRDRLGKATGTFAIYHKQICQPNADSLEIMSHAARLAGIAIELDRSQRALLHQHGQLEAAIRANRAGMWEWNLTTDRIIWSESIWPLYGLTLGEVEPSLDAWQDTVSDEDLPSIKNMLLDAVHQGREFELEWRVKSKSELPTRWLLSRGGPQQDADDRITHYIGLVIDITDRKQTEHELLVLNETLDQRVKQRTIALQESERIIEDERQRLQNILIGTRAGTWEWNVQTGEASFNERWAELVGYTLDELSPTSIDTWIKLLHPEDFQKSSLLLQKHFSGELPYYEFEARMRHKEGHWKWVIDRGKVISWTAEGKPLLMSGTHQDITERKAFEIALSLAKQEAEQANQAKSLFLATMSHEIRTPLNAIVGISHLLKDTVLSESQRQDLETIEVSSEQLLNLINDVLDFSKIDAGELVLEQRGFELSEILREQRKIFGYTANNKLLTFTIDPLPEALPVALFGDGNRLRQMLLNLLSNAIKFTHQGEIKLTVTERSRNEVDQTINLRFTVTDTGIGISKTAQSQLFEPFKQADDSTTRVYGGTGLGLSIVKQLATLMGGNIGVESEEDQGSTFWLDLPFGIASAEENEAEASPEFNTPSGVYVEVLDGYHIVVVDDSSINLRVVGRILKRAGAIVKLCDSGDSAIAYCTDHESTIDAILMDMQMPKLDGCETTSHLRQTLQLDIPILALTAGATSQEQTRAKAAGMAAFLTKPVDPRELVRVLRFHIEQNRKAIDPKTIDVTLPDNSPTNECWPSINGFDMDKARYLLDNDIDFFRELLIPFLNEHENIIKDIRVLMASGEIKKAAKRVHNLRGQAAYLGAIKLKETAGALEAGLINAETELDFKIQAFSKAHNEVFTSARNWLENA